MAFALKGGQRTRLHVAFLCADGSPGAVAGPPIWTSSNPAMVAIVEDPVSPDGLAVYVQCVGPVDPAVASPIVEISCAGQAALGTGVRLIQTLPFQIQPQAPETTAAVITVEVPEQIWASQEQRRVFYGKGGTWACLVPHHSTSRQRAQRQDAHGRREAEALGCHSRVASVRFR